jgi:hypothetical protein
MSTEKVGLDDWLPVVTEEFKSGRYGGVQGRQQAKLLLDSYGQEAAEHIIQMLFEEIALMGRKVYALDLLLNR